MRFQGRGCRKQILALDGHSLGRMSGALDIGGQDPAPEGLFGNDRRWGKPEPDQMLKHRPDTTLAALENRCTLARTEVSNPALSATILRIDIIV